MFLAIIRLFFHDWPTKRAIGLSNGTDSKNQEEDSIFSVLANTGPPRSSVGRSIASRAMYVLIRPFPLRSSRAVSLVICAVASNKGFESIREWSDLKEGM